MAKTKKPHRHYIKWTDDLKEEVSNLLERGYTYPKCCEILNRRYPEYNFTLESIRSQKRSGTLSVNPRIPLSPSKYRRKKQVLEPNLLDEGKKNPYYQSTTKDIEDDDEASGHNFETHGNYAILDYRGEDNPATLDDLLASCDVDTEIWDVERYVVNKWEVAMKMGETIVHRPLFQVKAWLVRKLPVVVEFPTIKTIRPIVYKPKPRKAKKCKDRTALIIPDAQVGFRKSFDDGSLDPFHDRKALDICLQMAEKHQPDEIILLGDMLDLPEWSDKFMISPEFYWTTQPSINELYWWIKELRQYCEKMIYIEGNHELRMAKAVVKNIVAAYNLKPANEPERQVLTVPTLLALDELGVEYCGPYPDGEYWINDNLRVHHGQLARKGGGKTASAMLNDARNSEIIGHIHRHEMAQRTVHPRGGIKTYVVYSPGTVARIDGVVPAYQTRNDWQQGLALVHYQEGNGLFQIVPYNIHDGVCMADGEVLKARKTILSHLEKTIK